MTSIHDTNRSIDASATPGLTPTDQIAVTGPVLNAGELTPTELWRALLDGDEIRDRLARDVRAVVAGQTRFEVRDALNERDVPAWLHDLLLSIGEGERQAAWRLVADVPDAWTPGPVPDTVPGLDPGGATTAGLLATAGLFGAGADGDPDGSVPTVSVVLSQAFREQRADERRTTLQLLTRVSAAVDVRVVTTGLTRRWLADRHREDLPGVSDWCTAPRDGTPVAAAVEDALSQLDPDGTAAEVLRLLANEPAETLSFGELYAKPALPSESRVRQILGTLADLELVERYGPDEDRRVEIREAGHTYLSRLADERAAQERLTECVSDPPKSSPQAVLPRASTGGGEGTATADSDRPAPRPYRTRWLDRVGHAAAAGAAVPSGVSVVRDDSLDERASDSRADAESDPVDRTRYVSVDPDREEVVTAVRATGAMQNVVSSALALASPRLLDRILTQERVEDIDEPLEILREARCIGALSDGILDDADALRETFREWREDLAGMTRELKWGKYEDRDRFRGEIMRTAHGLVGSLVHLFDVLGYDVVREIRVPGGLDERHHRGIARSVAVMAAVQSRYGAFTAYRQLFEDREDKRTSAFTPEVDAADPRGQLLGSVVVRGPDVHRYEDLLATTLSEPAPVHDDAPEFQVPVSVERAGRPAVERAVRRVCSRKRLRATDPAVSLLHGVTASPYVAARAVEQLGGETTRRDLQPRDVRYALASVSPASLLPERPASAGAILSALIRSAGPVSTGEVADRADVSRETVRTHRATLEALGLVELEDRGAGRETLVSVSFGVEDGESLDAYPGCVTDETRFVDVADAVVRAVVSVEQYVDPTGRVYRALSHPADPWSLADVGDVGSWLSVGGRLAGVGPPDREPTTVVFGPAVEQEPLPAADGSADSEVTS